MSAVLNSFDKSKELPQTQEPSEGVNRSTGIGFGKNRSGNSIRNVFNSDEDDDIEFEDSFIETPKSLVRKNSSSFSGTRKNHENENNQREFIVKNTTVKIPLKDGDEDMGPRKFSTPNSVSRLDRYGVRNGTPLKLPPVNSSSIPENTIEEDTTINEIKQDTLIRSRKLISDTNQFSPGRIPTRKSSLTHLSPNKVKVNPSRNGSSIIYDKISSPPTNLKVRPLDLSTIQKSQIKSHKDIEFDSSDENGEGDHNNDDNNNDNLHNDDEEIQFNLPSENKSPISYKSEYVNLNERNENPKPEPEQSNTKSNTHISSPRNGLEDISRADLLERINNTINSIKENDKLSSPVLPKKTTNQQLDDFKPNNIIDDYSSSSESPVELLDQLDSHIFYNKDSLKERSDLINMDRAFLPDFDLNTEVSSISRPTIINGSSLALKYAENISGEVNIGTPDNEVSVDNSPPHVSATNYREEWPMEKWSKLMRIVNSNKFTKKDIINSGILRSSLGCLSKEEFKSRVNFLMEFKRVLDLKRSNLRNKKRIKSKMKYAKKHF